MINFQYFLTSIGLDLSRVRLARHQAKAPVGVRPYDHWMAKGSGSTNFELYQSIQGGTQFSSADWIASFVVTPFDETLFAGLYRVNGCGIAPPGTFDPVERKDVAGMNLYDLVYDPRLAEYEGRMVIDWGPGARAWIQKADNKLKKVLEIRLRAQDPPFPGFSEFRWPIKQLPAVPQKWQFTLSAVCGVYLLACKHTGKMYVGSAAGDRGFWGRWQDYYLNGHGGNTDMRKHDGEYMVTILEYTSDRDGLRGAETRWKEKLLSREFGLNKN